MTRAGSRVLGLAVAVLAFAIVAVPPATRGTQAAMTATTSNASNVASNLSLTSPTGLTATGTRFSVALSWTAATPNNGNGNGYAISGVNNGASSTCPTTASSYTTWVGSTTSSTTTFTDTGTIASGTAGTWACYLVQTGYNSAGGPPWASAPQWTSQSGLATVAFKLAAPVKVQSGAEAAGTTSVAPALASGSTAGDLLVVTLVSNDTTIGATGPAGWTRAARATDATAGAVEIWYLANAGAGVTSASFSDAFATSMHAQVSEYSGILGTSPLDATGTVDVATAAGSATVSTTAATTASSELAVTAFVYSKGVGSSAAGWTNLVNDGTNFYISDYQVQAAAAVESETATSTKSARWAGAVATFK